MFCFTLIYPSCLFWFFFFFFGIRLRVLPTDDKKLRLQLSLKCSISTRKSHLNCANNDTLSPDLETSPINGEVLTAIFKRVECEEAGQGSPAFLFLLPLLLRYDMHCWLSGKASACSAGDPVSIPGSGGSPGGGRGNPLKSSCLEKPMDRGAWRATDHGAAESRTQLSD